MSEGPSDPADFDRDTALSEDTDGVLHGSLSERWRAARGPHGGYVTALILRGLTIAVGDASRAPLTLTVHFLREPAFGLVELHPRVERTGRTLTSVSARLVQGGEPAALAVASFAAPMSGLEYDELPMPEVEAPSESGGEWLSEQAPRFAHNLVLQPRFGRPFRARNDPMVAGGWTALPGRRPLDAPALALVSDTWFSPPYIRLDRFVPSPTVTLSVYFRAHLPRPGAEDEHMCLARFETRLVRDGCFQSSGVVWAPDGTVLAQSHQLQLLLGG